MEITGNFAFYVYEMGLENLINCVLKKSQIWKTRSVVGINNAIPLDWLNLCIELFKVKRKKTFPITTFL